MYGYSTGTPLNRVAKLSLPVQALGCGGGLSDIDIFSLRVMLLLYPLLACGLWFSIFPYHINSDLKIEQG